MNASPAKAVPSRPSALAAVRHQLLGSTAVGAIVIGAGIVDLAKRPAVNPAAPSASPMPNPA